MATTTKDAHFDLLRFFGGGGGLGGVIILLTIDLNNIWHSLPHGSWSFPSSLRWGTLLKITCSLIWSHAHQNFIINWLPIQIFWRRKICYPTNKKHSRPCESNVYHFILKPWHSHSCFNPSLVWLIWVSLLESGNSRWIWKKKSVLSIYMCLLWKLCFVIEIGLLSYHFENQWEPIFTKCLRLHGMPFNLLIYGLYDFMFSPCLSCLLSVHFKNNVLSNISETTANSVRTR